MKLLSLIMVCLTGGLLLYGTADLPDWGDPNAPASLHLSNYYIENTIRDTQVPNLVTAVLADYRSVDTMFETAVVFCAGLACFLLLRDFTPKKDHYYRHVPSGVILHVKNPDRQVIVGNEFEDIDKDWLPPDTTIKTVCRMLIPFIQIYALYVVAHGDFSPGGGFQGGVIFGSSLILLAISYNLKYLLKRVSEKFLGILSAAGVLVFVGIGVVAMVLGGNFLDYERYAPILGEHHIRALGMLGVEIGVGMAVTAVMVIIYINIVSEGKHDEGL